MTREERLKTAALSSGEGEEGDKPRFTPFDRRPDLLNRAEVVVALERAYPPLLRQAGIGGTTYAWISIDERGQVTNAVVSRSSGHEEIDAAALKVARILKFTPAGRKGENVAVMIELPFTFRAPEAK